jgi:hypothetical protein
MPTPNDTGAAFFTWSGTGRVSLWGLDGGIKSSFQVSIGQVESVNESDPVNQLCLVRATKGAKSFLSGDRLGVLRLIDLASKECTMETKAHMSDLQDIAIYEDGSKAVMASCGRDRTVQLFRRSQAGPFEHLQTLEFAAKVVQVLVPSDEKLITCSLDRTLQVHDLVSKEGKPDVMAAIPLKVISLKASPSSMALAPDGKSVFVSLLDRSVCQYDMGNGKLLNSFKCTDEGGAESVVVESLIFGRPAGSDSPFLLGVSNTDKSIRIYDSQTGLFLDREWGHTEAINGVILLEDGDAGRKVVSVGSDGTIMVWALDLSDPVASSPSRDPSPEKVSASASNRLPLRRVLSKAELAEFQRPSPSAGRQSPSRAAGRRFSRFNVSSTAAARTPVALDKTSPASAIDEDTPSRRASPGESPSGSPPLASPKGRIRLPRRPSLPVMNTTPPAPSTLAARKKSSTSNLRASCGFGSLNMATEQTCRMLRTYRKKLTGTDLIGYDMLAELDAELRLTAAALGDRAIRSRSKPERARDKAVSETVLSGLLDQYSKRLVSILDEKLRMRADKEAVEEGKEPDRSRAAAVGEEGSSPNSSSGEDRSGPK